jgi:hypothetical protein
MLEILEKPDTSKPNRHLSVFQGILPSLQNLNDDQTIEFQLGVLNVIKNVKKHRRTFPPTQNFPSHQPIHNMPGFSGCSSIHPPSPAAGSYPQVTPICYGWNRQIVPALSLSDCSSSDTQFTQESEFDLSISNFMINHVAISK